MSIQNHIFYLVLITTFILFPLIASGETQSNTVTLKFKIKGWINIYRDYYVNLFNTSALDIYLISENSLISLNFSEFDITNSPYNYVKYYTNSEETIIFLKFNKILNSTEALFYYSSAYSIEFSENFDFSHVIKMNKMFRACQ